MKMRQLKSRLFTTKRRLKSTLTIMLFQVSRRKDGALVKIVDSRQEANALIEKAKTSKKAALFISGSYRQKYAQ